jgi:hypothetical protein
MTPRQAYDHIAVRARRLLRLHDGLVNTRQRKMRRDWKAGFCRLMHWRQDSGIDRVDSKDALIILRHGASLSSSDFSASAVDDLLRAALALGVGALDRYVHERVVKQVIRSLRGRTLRPAQERLAISAPLALRMTEALRKAARDGKRIRPANQFRIALQETLHRRTFQNWREIEEAFELIGISGLAGKLQSAYGVADITPIRSQLNNIAQRRHFIVHEGDLIRHQRGGQTRVHPITRKYVQDSLAFFDTLVAHLEATV